MTSITQTQAINNSVFASAFGDAWGYRQEFRSFNEIATIKPPFPEGVAYITDDTQMGIAAMTGVLNSWKQVKLLESDPSNGKAANLVRLAIAEEFLKWFVDPRNNRAPGSTCMTALGFLKRVKHIKTGREETNVDSKGCGANMRNPLFGLLPLSEETIIRLSLLQCEITHSHPLALSSAVLTALMTRAVFNGEVNIGQGDGSLFAYALRKTRELKNLPNPTDTYLYPKGLEMMEEFLEAHAADMQVFLGADSSTDPCYILNSEGWVAEEAFLVALAITDLHGEDAIEVLRRTITTNGDSDSMAAISGAFVGAGHIEPVFPEDWYSRLEPEYYDDLKHISSIINSK